jgi:hypothetical protein
VISKFLQSLYVEVDEEEDDSQAVGKGEAQ